MPIHEYACRACGHRFETLVRPSTIPACPGCASQDLERLLSLPAVKSDGTHEKALASAKKRDSKQARENMHARIEYERSHD